MKRILTESAGPGSQRNWNRRNEHFVGHPEFRAKRNPASSANLATPAAPGSASPQFFPYAGVGANGESLEIVAWSLRDSLIALASTGIFLNSLQYLFTSGQNTAYQPLGATSSFNKPDLLCNINSNTGQLAYPQSFLVGHVKQLIREDIYIKDMLNLANSTLYQFLCGDLNRPYLDEPGKKIPTGEAAIQVQYPGSGANLPTAGNSSMGWATVHNAWAASTGLLDPSLADAGFPNGKPDMGIVINQGRQFKFTIDPTQFSFIAATVAQGGWTTTAAASGGTGIQLSIELVGCLARSLAG
jgi:hypothetical protein